MDKFITIITPTYNRATNLRSLYRSLLSQTNNNFIWLIVDDGSTDDTNNANQGLNLPNKIVVDRFLLESPLADAPQVNGDTLLISKLGTEIVALALHFSFDYATIVADSAI